jgi:polynucleotide 5'-hydroxyl-kinase GRC3/NOL9
VSPGPSLVADTSWAAALAATREARVVLVLGETDTGKTSLVTYLAGALLDDGRSVAVVDADLGQSEIGPPTTVGLGELRAPVARLGDAGLRGLAFVGATSPVAHVRPTVLATGRMTERALRLGVDHVLIDTSGLVQGEIGRLLKLQKIERVAPDVVLCLQRDGECEHILHTYAAGAPAILRLGAASAVRRRSADQRRRRRESAFARYLAGARQVELDLGRVLLGEPRQPGDALDDVQDVVVGLDRADGETLGLGVVLTVDLARRAMALETPVPADGIAAVRLGEVRLRLLDNPDPALPPLRMEVKA